MNNFKEAKKEMVKLATEMGVKIKTKEDSWFMQLLGKLMFFNKNFLKDYISVIGNTIYFPKEVYENDGVTAFVLTHELRHAKDYQTWSFQFISLLYLFPQILGLLFILGFFLHPLWFLCLLFFLPIPALGRAWVEARAYGTETAIRELLYGEKGIAEYKIRAFLDSSYYFMWPFRKSVECWLKKEIERQKKDEFTLEMFKRFKSGLEKKETNN